MYALARSVRTFPSFCMLHTSLEHCMYFPTGGGGRHGWLLRDPPRAGTRPSRPTRLASGAGYGAGAPAGCKYTVTVLYVLWCMRQHAAGRVAVCGNGEVLDGASWKAGRQRSIPICFGRCSSGMDCVSAVVLERDRGVVDSDIHVMFTYIHTYTVHTYLGIQSRNRGREGCNGGGWEGAGCFGESS